MRPFALIQAELLSVGRATLHCEPIKEELIKNHNIPEREICIATGTAKGINEPSCLVKYIITQKILAEGWDYPWAYILSGWPEPAAPRRWNSYWGAS